MLKRIIDDDSVYLLVSEIEKETKLTEEQLNSFGYTYLIPEVGKCVLEETYNAAVKQFNTGKQIFTFVQTSEKIEDEAKGLIKMKGIFSFALEDKAKEHNMTVSEYLNTIEYQETLNEKYQQVIKHKSLEKKIREERKLLDECLNRDALKECGMTVQTLAMISNEKAMIKHFIAGKGVFMEIYPESEDYNEIKINENGYLSFYDITEDCEPVEFERGTEREYNKYPVLDNIIYILKNKEGSNEWTDELQYENDGVRLFVPMKLLMVLMNEKNCEDVVLYDKLPEIHTKEIVTR